MVGAPRTFGPTMGMSSMAQRRERGQRAALTADASLRQSTSFEGQRPGSVPAHRRQEAVQDAGVRRHRSSGRCGDRSPKSLNVSQFVAHKNWLRSAESPRRFRANTCPIKAVGIGGASQALGTFLNLDPQDAIFTPRGRCLKDTP
jgi:hypothetical protein